MFGFYARGTDGHLILGDDHPVLCQAYRGRLVINQPLVEHLFPDDFIGSNGRGYAYCEIRYPQPIRTAMPPMVFGVPTAMSDGKGLGLFQHRGGSGNWIGFGILIARDLFASSTAQAWVDMDSGWEYRVCVFGDPGVTRSSPSRFGLALYDANGNPTFHSNWPFVPFRGLLSGWSLHSFTRHYALGSYFGNSDRGSGSIDTVLAKGIHTWGAQDGKLGFLISSLGTVPLRSDIGYAQDRTVDCVVLMGFPDSRRDLIWSSIFYGLSQHPSANMSAMNDWRILTADFTYV